MKNKWSETGPWKMTLGYPAHSGMAFKDRVLCLLYSWTFGSKSPKVKVEVCSVTKSCPNLCDPMGCSLLDSSVHKFPRQEYWSSLPFPSSGDLPNLRIKPVSPAWQADSFHWATWEVPTWNYIQNPTLGVLNIVKSKMIKDFRSQCKKIALWVGARKTF